MYTRMLLLGSSNVNGNYSRDFLLSAYISFYFFHTTFP